MPMELYLPIAEMSVHWLGIIGIGFGVGYLSGLLGIGGGFLLAPLLMFYGVPPAIAVGTTTNHVTAITFSGLLSRLKRNAVDLKMGGLMVASGFIGTFIGISLFAWLQRIGQMELVISVGYVLLLGSVGVLMLNESVHTMLARRHGEALPQHNPHQHSWILKLPLKMRFRTSKLYISALPPVALGLSIGILSSVLGIGGGFLMIPVMIYVLRMPTHVAIGTSTLQVFFVSAASTFFHAVEGHSVDVVLALMLIIGGVTGVQYGVKMSGKMRGEMLRLLMAALVLAVAVRLLAGLILPPADLYSIRMGMP